MSSTSVKTVVQVYLVSITKSTAYFVEELVVSNLTYATLPDGELYIFVKQQTVTLHCHLQIQYLPEVCSRYGKMHMKNRLE